MLWSVAVSILSFSVSLKFEGKWKPVLGHPIIPSVIQVSHTPLSYYWGQSSNFNLYRIDIMIDFLLSKVDVLNSMQTIVAYNTYVCVHQPLVRIIHARHSNQTMRSIGIYSIAWCVVCFKVSQYVSDEWRSLCNPPHKANFSLDTRLLFTALLKGIHTNMPVCLHTFIHPCTYSTRYGWKLNIQYTIHMYGSRVNTITNYYCVGPFVLSEFLNKSIPISFERVCKV